MGGETAIGAVNDKSITRVTSAESGAVEESMEARGGVESLRRDVIVGSELGFDRALD